MSKKFWNIAQYIILVILLVAMANALYLKSLRHILGGILFITFWITMILDNKFQNKNKFVSFMYYFFSHGKMYKVYIFNKLSKRI